MAGNLHERFIQVAQKPQWNSNYAGKGHDASSFIFDVILIQTDVYSTAKSVYHRNIANP
jgi:hypothetical protein